MLPLTRILALLLLAWGAGAGAATLYVDPTCAVSGNGSAQDCSAGGNAPLAGITSPTSNNTYLFKSGTTLNKTAALSISGVTNVTLGIYGGTSRARVVVNSTPLFALYVHDSTNIIVGDMSFTSVSEAQTYCAAIYVDESTTTDNITFNNVEATLSPQGLAIHKGVSNVVINGGNFSDNTFTTRNDVNSSGILVAGASGVTGYDFISSRNGLLATAFDSGQGAYLNEGRGITIQDESGTASTGVTFRRFTAIDNGDRVGDEGSGVEGANAQNVTIERAFIYGSTGLEVKRSANTWVVRSSIIAGKSSAVIQYGYFTSDSTGSSFENNTIIGLRAAGKPYQVLMGLTSASACASCRNNLLIYGGVMSASNAVGFQLGRSGWTSTELATFDNVLDYNAVWGVNSAKYVETITGSSVFTDFTLAAWKAAHSAQAAHDINADPLLVGGEATSPSSYRLKSSSPLIRAGTRIGLYTDYLGRGFDPANPDIGAMSYGAGDMRGTALPARTTPLGAAP